MGRAGDVVGMRVVEAQREMEPALVVAAVDAEDPLGRAAVPSRALSPSGAKPRPMG
jgi:hypothetical protein